MPSNLIQANAIVVANQFNPSVVSQLWLVDNGIALREEFEIGQGSVFSDMMVNVVTKKFSMLVTPDQVQFSPKEQPPTADCVVASRLGLLVRTLPHTPYTACGLNFTWLLDDENVADVAKRMFFVPDSAVHRAFNVDDCRFGGYMSRPELGGRLKLDIKPITLKSLAIDVPVGPQTERIQFAFNFHFDLTETSQVVDVLVSNLGKWNEAFEITSNIMRLLENEK